MVQFQTRTDQFFWPEDGLRIGKEKCDDANTINGDESRRTDGETSDIIIKF